MGPKFVLELDTLEMGLLVGLLKVFSPGDPVGIHLSHRLLNMIRNRYAEEKLRQGRPHTVAEALGIETHEGDGEAG